MKTRLSWDLTQSPFAPGQICDLRTYGGVFRACLLLLPFLLVGWYIDDLFLWIGHLDEIDPRQQAWHRLIFSFLAVGSFGGALLCVIGIAIQRRRAAKSTKGQWYDDPALTREALHGKPDEPVDHKAGAIGASDRARREEKSS